MPGAGAPGGADDSTVGCQDGKQHLYFACQISGTGLHGETVTGCGRSMAAGTGTLAGTRSGGGSPATGSVHSLPNTAGGAVTGVAWGALVVLTAGEAVLRRRRRRLG